jgi:hypothetical protein|tara:strand:- start:2363 stop:2587 length:225 start_codon:yes stop_codon:yes gene_type:complete
MTSLQIRRHELCGEFWLDLSEIINQAGGDPDIIIEAYMDASLSEFVELAAPNGIRLTYKKEGHLNPNMLPPNSE